MWAIEGVLLARTRAEVCDEVLKHAPAFTNCDAFAALISEAFMLGIEAALQHPAP